MASYGFFGAASLDWRAASQEIAQTR